MTQEVLTTLPAALDRAALAVLAEIVAVRYGGSGQPLSLKGPEARDKGEG